MSHDKVHAGLGTLALDYCLALEPLNFSTDEGQAHLLDCGEATEYDTIQHTGNYHGLYQQI